MGVRAFGIDDQHLSAILISEKELQDRVRELGCQITRDFQNRNPLLIAILKGAYPFLADLARAIDLAVEIDFMAG